MSIPNKPLSGIRVIEFEGIGPCPLAGMMLADMGAEVIQIGRKTANSNAANIRAKDHTQNFCNRGKRSILLDLKAPEDANIALQLMASAQVVIEGFRPGVMEKLGLGPNESMALNPSVIYGRLTGWGQTGPLAQAAGHDPNYVALSGALHAGSRPCQKPTVPLTLVGDVGGGTMMLLWGIMCALWQSQTTGKGQVIDAAITDGAIYSSSLLWMMHNTGMLPPEGGKSWADGASPWNDTYLCADGRYITICALEPKFYGLLLDYLGLAQEPCLTQQWNQQHWPQAQALLQQVFSEHTQSHWCGVFEGTDVCFAPVLDFDQAASHPHNVARQAFIKLDGVTQPAPAPKMAHDQTAINSPPAMGQDGEAILAELGITL